MHSKGAKVIKAIGLHREATIAGKPEADMAICNLVGKRLREKGFEVEMVEPQDFKEGLRADMVFSMARTKKIHEILQTYLDRNVFVINDPKAVADSMNRELSYRRLQEAGVAVPETRLVPLGELSMEALGGKAILKRPDRHEFTTVVENEKQLNEAIKSYKEQGLGSIIVQRFVSGKHVKYYAIGEEIFLMNTETVAGKAREQMEEQAVLAGKATGLDIYGGDFIAAGEKAWLVDINDWPSFSAIREEAAAQIAELIKREYGKMRAKKC